VRQEKHGFRGQPAVADCVEACAREALGLALWDRRTGRYCASHLPPSCDPALARFFGPGGAAMCAHSAGRQWFELCSARPGLHYMLGTHGTANAHNGSAREMAGTAESELPSHAGGDGGRSSAFAYELFPSVASFTRALASLLGCRVEPPIAEVALPVWPGSALHWKLEGCSRHPVIFMRRVRRASSETETGLAEAESQGAVDELWEKEETLRVVFNGARHCYMLRDAELTSPAWVQGVAASWCRVWEQQSAVVPPPARAAAARLLC